MAGLSFSDQVQTDCVEVDEGVVLNVSFALSHQLAFLA